MDYSGTLEELRVRGVKLIDFPGSALFPFREIQKLPENKGLKRLLLERLSNFCHSDNLYLWVELDSLLIKGGGSFIWRNRSGELEIESATISDDRFRAHIGLRWGDNSIFLGRKSIHWGYGWSPLLLSGTPKAFYFLLYTLKCSNFKLSLVLCPVEWVSPFFDHSQIGSFTLIEAHPRIF